MGGSMGSNLKDENLEDLPPCPFCSANARVTEFISIGCSNLISCPVKPRVQSTTFETAKAKWAHRTRSVNLEQMTKEQLEWLLVEAQSELLVRLGQKLNKKAAGEATRSGSSE